MDKANVQVVVLSGVFYRQDDSLLVADDDLGAVSVEKALEPLLGQTVTFVAHHCPPDPPLPDRWGGGCCLEQPSGHCHVGHHDRPSYLYEANCKGVLRYDDGEWSITKEDGTKLKLYLDFLVGHQSQIVATVLPDLEELKAEIMDDTENPSIERLQARITQLREFLSMIQREKDELKP